MLLLWFYRLFGGDQPVAVVDLQRDRVTIARTDAERVVGELSLAGAVEAHGARLARGRGGALAFAPDVHLVAQRLAARPGHDGFDAQRAAAHADAEVRPIGRIGGERGGAEKHHGECVYHAPPDASGAPVEPARSLNVRAL